MDNAGDLQISIGTIVGVCESFQVMSLSLSPLFLRFVVNFDWELPGEATAGARGALEKRRRGGAAEWMDSQESLSVQVMGNGL